MRSDLDFSTQQSAQRDASSKDLLLRSQAELTEVTEQLMARQAECKDLRARLLVRVWRWGLAWGLGVVGRSD